MKKILLALTLALTIFLHLSPVLAHAQTAPQAGVAAPGDTEEGEGETGGNGDWIQDSEVTFVGKTATRSNDFLNWTLQNYDWLCIQRNSDGSCNNDDNPLRKFWRDVTLIPMAFIALFILAGAFVMIITRGQNVTIKKFIPRVLFIVALMALSFSVVQFLYVLTDIFQSQFLVLNQENNEVIQSDDLLFIDFDYEFTGYRRVGMEYEESAYISLVLVKLTAITYYVMTGILIVRKVILWFFLIISSIFPLLLFYRPLRNTAKVWVGEFFRWLLYAPLFALFLRGLVEMWRKGIPLPFDFSQVGTQVYPTAISILLAGPGQQPSIDNSVNLSDTFALYVVALIMLWVVIILPFLLLKIFLDYLNTVSFGQMPIFQNINRRFNIFNPPPTRGPSPGSPTPPPTKPQPAGQARALPFLHKPMTTATNIRNQSNISNVSTRDENIRRTTDIRSNVRNVENIRKTTEVLKTANISIPKMQDIARFETQTMQRDKGKSQEVNHIKDTLAQIANPTVITNSQEREKINSIKETLTKEREQGNPIAKQVLQAAKVTTQVQAQGAQGTMQAGSGQAPGAGPAVQVGAPVLPVVNTTQQVSLEDYEEVRKMWVENYKTLEPPADVDGKAPTREEWIKQDEQKIDEAVVLLTAPDKAKVDQGMEMVANILPFLLIGGFSKSEVVAYLKAKREAGVTVLEDLAGKKDEEDTMLDRDITQKAEQKEAVMHEELPDPTEAAATAPKPGDPNIENPFEKEKNHR